MCCGSSLTGDLPCAVWSAGVAACVCVVALPSPATCLVRSGRQGWLLVCVLWLFPDRRLAWPAGVAACVCVVALP